MMHYNRVGNTSVQLSAIGFGTAQFPMVSEQQAIETLKRGFELGVNWVHVSHEYGDAAHLIAQAIKESGKDIIVLAQASGDVDHFAACFEIMSRVLGRRQLGMFGINCMNDCEYLQQNVWGAGGMAEFLAQKKREGRIRASFCTTHGPPEDIERVIRSGYFDAVMMAYNPIGFHLFTYYPDSLGRVSEDISQHRERVFPVALEHGVSILVMKALAGGLLCRSKALPPHEWLGPADEPLAAGDLLKLALEHPAVCGVAVGTASVEEAEENARAGYQPTQLSPDRRMAIERAVGRTRTAVCSRCGKCESTCSRSLPISTMYRDAYLWNYRSEPSMSLDRENYFFLHPGDVLTCDRCTEQTCLCPVGIDIPHDLARTHDLMLRLRAEKLRPGSPEHFPRQIVAGRFPLLVLSREVPERLPAGEPWMCRLILQNAGDSVWLAPTSPHPGSPLALAVYIRGRLTHRLPLRHDVPPGARTAFVFELRAPRKAGVYDLEFFLAPLSSHKKSRKDGTAAFASPLVVGARPQAIPARVRLGTRLRDGLRRIRKRTTRGIRNLTPRGIQKLATRLQWLGPPRAPQTDAAGKPPEMYGVRYIEHEIPGHLPAGRTVSVRLTMQNAGRFAWRSHPPGGDSVDLVVRVDGDVRATHKLPAEEVGPGEQVTVHVPLRLPAEPGRHALCLELVEQTVAEFRDRGVVPLCVDLLVEAACESATTRVKDLAARVSPWYYNASHGIEVSREGHPFPIFVSRAKGCRLWDLEGREYIDYIMGWGSTVLGYADDRVQDAIRSMLDTAPLTPFPYALEIEVAQMLTEDFPCAEMAIFGKNGSDVCTVAARLARSLTGRRVILFSGYHGWQDFWAESTGYERSGVPDRPEPLIHRFRFNDRDDFFRLYHRHRHDLAAVMIEPSGPWGGDDVGPEPDADPAFLAAMADATRKAGALLVFDEIVTGYRYPTGSVQKATGIVPDVACLGKALASGMPLSALVGRADLLQRGLHRTLYGPTFRGEAYSLAAAKAAIQVYRQEPVAAHIWSYGVRLQASINALCQDLGIDAECKGPPFRFALIFKSSSIHTVRKKRTLYHQELLKQGVTTLNGVMLPAYAHDEAVLERTVAAVRSALQVVATADREGALDRYLEIPVQ